MNRLINFLYHYLPGHETDVSVIGLAYLDCSLLLTDGIAASNLVSCLLPLFSRVFHIIAYSILKKFPILHFYSIFLVFKINEVLQNHRDRHCGLIVKSFWLLTQRSRVRFLALPHFLSSSRSGTGCTQPL
jgi:hypothetical protein